MPHGEKLGVWYKRSVIADYFEEKGNDAILKCIYGETTILYELGT